MSRKSWFASAAVVFCAAYAFHAEAAVELVGDLPQDSDVGYSQRAGGAQREFVLDYSIIDTSTNRLMLVFVATGAHQGAEATVDSVVATDTATGTVYTMESVGNFDTTVDGWKPKLAAYALHDDNGDGGTHLPAGAADFSIKATYRGNIPNRVGLTAVTLKGVRMNSMEQPWGAVASSASANFQGRRLTNNFTGADKVPDGAMVVDIFFNFCPEPSVPKNYPRAKFGNSAKAAVVATGEMPRSCSFTASRLLNNTGSEKAAALLWRTTEPGLLLTLAVTVVP